jgi:hypothetical protein
MLYTEHILECLFAILMVHLPSLDSFPGYTLFRSWLLVDNIDYEYLVVGSRLYICSGRLVVAAIMKRSVYTKRYT